MYRVRECQVVCLNEGIWLTGDGERYVNNIQIVVNRWERGRQSFFINITTTITNMHNSEMQRKPTFEKYPHKKTKMRLA